MSLCPHQEQSISIHALRGEGDFSGISAQGLQKHFNPRPPWGGRPLAQSGVSPRKTISIHALRGEGDDVRWNTKRLNSISIHALRGEGDPCFC